MAMLSQTLRNLKFMKNKKTESEKVMEKTLSYYACKNIVATYCQGMQQQEKNNPLNSKFRNP